MNDSLITPKQGQNKATDLRAWRSTCFLNSDHKILAKYLSLRLTPILNTIAGPQQACCVPRRSVELHGIAIKDLLTWYAANNTRGIFMALDQEKAFHRLSHSYVFEQLAYALISQQFIEWVKILYAAPRAAVIAQGQISEPFALQRGVRRGCPLSRLLHVMVIEPLLQGLSSTPAGSTPGIHPCIHHCHPTIPVFG